MMDKIATEVFAVDVSRFDEEQLEGRVKAFKPHDVV